MKEALLDDRLEDFDDLHNPAGSEEHSKLANMCTTEAICFLTAINVYDTHTHTHTHTHVVE